MVCCHSKLAPGKKAWRRQRQKLRTAGNERSAVLLIPDSIQRDGNPINGTNNTVWVGQQICLTNVISGVATNAITSYLWKIPGANNTTNDTAFYDYKPTSTSSNWTNLFTPTNYTTNNYCNFYWSAGGTNQVSCTTVIYGQTNTVTATLNVQRPTDTITTPQIGTIKVDTSDSSYPGEPALYFGDDVTGTIPGITFTNAAPSASSVGTNLWVQVITSDVITLMPPTTNFASRVGLDSGAFPYQAGLTTQDSPDNKLSSIRSSNYRNFNATMYLMWQPTSTNAVINGDKTVPVPLKGYPWNWIATATNSAYGTTNAQAWTLVPGAQYPPTNAANIDATNEPTWSTNSGFPYPTYP